MIDRGRSNYTDLKIAVVMAIILAVLWTFIMMAVLDVHPRVVSYEDGSVSIYLGPPEKAESLIFDGCLYPSMGCGKIDWEVGNGD